MRKEEADMRFEVDTNQVSQTVTKMTELIRNIADGKSQMMNAVGSLSAMWEGEAHDAFLAQVQVDDGELQTLVQDLDAIAELLREEKPGGRGKTRRGQYSQLGDIQVIRVFGDLHHFFSCLLPVLSAVSAVA